MNFLASCPACGMIVIGPDRISLTVHPTRIYASCRCRCGITFAAPVAQNGPLLRTLMAAGVACTSPEHRESDGFARQLQDDAMTARHLRAWTLEAQG